MLYLLHFPCGHSICVSDDNQMAFYADFVPIEVGYNVVDKIIPETEIINSFRLRFMRTRSCWDWRGQSRMPGLH